MNISVTCRVWVASTLLAGCTAAAAQHSTAGASTKPSPSSDRPQFATTAPKDGHVVDVFAVISDKRSGPLQNLRREDFQLLADKRPQPIGEFTPARDLPLTLGLVVDASPAQREALEEERTASATFLGNLLNDTSKTKAFVVQFGRDVDLLQDTTSSRDSIRAAVRQLETDRATRVAAVNTPDSRPSSSPN